MNKLLLLLLPIVALLGTTSSNSAQADSWTYISESVSDVKYYVNDESIKKKYNRVFYMIEGGGSVSSSRYTEAWWKAVNTDGSYRQTKTNFLCSDDMSKDISNVSYSATDKYINSPSVGSSALSTIPGTSFGAVFSFVCS